MAQNLDGNLMTFLYDANQSTNRYQFETAGRLTKQLEHNSVVNPSLPRLDTYEAAGTQKNRNQDSMITTFTYDKFHRLIGEPRCCPEPTFIYDPPENPQEQTAAARVTTCVYDKENRLSYLVLPEGIRTTFTYNPEGLQE